MKARVYVTLKEGVLDPQGRAVLGALRTMNFKEVKDVRIGKFMEIEVEGASREEEEERIRQMCEKLLANPVIEKYRIEVD